MALVTFVARLRELAEEDPGRPAITCGGVTLSRAELESRANRLARDLSLRGVTAGAMVTIALPNSVDWLVTVVATWKLAATPQPVSHKLPPRELAAIVELAQPAVVVGVPAELAPNVPSIPAGYAPPAELSDAPLPNCASLSWKAPTSGGSTGRPKLIVSGDPSLFDAELPPPFEMRLNGCLAVPGPMYHNGPFLWAAFGVLYGNHVVLMPKFDPEQTLELVARHGADQLFVVPTMMKRIWRLPDEVRSSYDVASLHSVWHGAEPCPAWLKEAWIGWLGPERIFELYGATEGQATSTIVGTEWLEHRGSVGRPIIGEMAVFDTDGNRLPPGESGEVWFRAAGEQATYRYVGAEPRRREDGWESLGDNGYLDADGYVYLNDRSEDMILVGGANVYPAEIESAIQEHALVQSCAVIGLPDDDKGNRVHAIVEADPLRLQDEDLLEFLRERLAVYKLPRSVEFVDEPLRGDDGKVRRKQLRADRLAPQLAT
ncbi:MAG TPA: AMP-binding protein [Mycobacteriales bacterium]|nr:AMP-binding protein [Mycobacteriales bacterium]